MYLIFNVLSNNYKINEAESLLSRQTMTPHQDYWLGQNCNDMKYSAMGVHTNTMSPHLHENIPLLEALVHCFLVISNTSLYIMICKQIRHAQGTLKFQTHYPGVSLIYLSVFIQIKPTSQAMLKYLNIQPTRQRKSTTNPDNLSLDDV